MILDELNSILGYDCKFTLPIGKYTPGINVKKDDNEKMFNYYNAVDMDTCYIVNANLNYYTLNYSVTSTAGFTENLYANINGISNKYINSIERASLTSNFLTKYKDATDEEIQKILNTLNRIYCPYIDTSLYGDRRLNIILYDLRAHIYSMMFLYYNQSCVGYESNPKKLAIKNKDGNTEKYKLLLLPRDLLKKFQNIESNINEIKELLELDPKTGYYSYKVDGVYVQILCKHVYMFLTNVNPADISIECYSDGVCKYCGEEMFDYNSRMSDSLNSNVISVIYRFIETIDENIHVSNMFFTLFDLLYKSIETNKVDKNNDNILVAFSSLFLFKVYLLSKDALKWKKTALTKFIEEMTEYCAAVGWNKDIIDSNINNEDIFKNLSNISVIMRSKIYDDESNLIEMLPSTVLFNLTSKTDKKVAKNEFQKIFLEGYKQVEEFNKIYQLLLLSYWKFKNVSDILKLFNRESSYNIININIKKELYGEYFFDMMSQYYCPKNYIHSWSNNVCKYCGLKKDLDNSNEVYKEYINKINQQSVEKPSTITFKKHEDTTKALISSINVVNEKDFIKSLFDENITLFDAITKNIAENKNMYNAAIIISGILSIEKSYVKNNDFVIKAFKYIYDNKILNRGDIINKIIFIYMRNDDVSLILL